MKQVGSFGLPRWVHCSKTSRVQHHAFADASRRAMAAVVYCRSTEDSQLTTSLLWAKTKLAPLKNLGSSAVRTARMTIPRLELRAALLAARLLQFIAEHLDVPLSDCHLWSDSQVVLHWLCSDGPTGHDFVDNYVQHIQGLVPDSTWHHVPTADNQADAATKGLDVASLGQSSLWWRGPSWLGDPAESWPLRRPFVPPTSQENSADLTCLAASLPLNGDTYPIERFSSLNRLLRIMTRCRRILLRRSIPEAALPLSTITTSDIRRKWLACIRLSQQQDFNDVINQLRQGQSIGKGSSLRTISPFLDDEGILRVSGRLSHSQLPYDEKHPVILSGRSHLGKLVIDWAHLRSFHAGFRTTYAYTIQRAWIVGGRVAVKALVRR